MGPISSEFTVTGKYGRLSSRATLFEPEQDGHRLLGADHGDGDDGHAGPHGDLDEPTPPEPAQPVPIGVGLGGGLGALGEDQGQLLLVVEEPVGVVRMGRHTSRSGTTWSRPPGWS